MFIVYWYSEKEDPLSGINWDFGIKVGLLSNNSSNRKVNNEMSEFITAWKWKIALIHEWIENLPIKNLICREIDYVWGRDYTDISITSALLLHYNMMASSFLHWYPSVSSSCFGLSAAEASRGSDRVWIHKWSRREWQRGNERGERDAQQRFVCW